MPTARLHCCIVVSFVGSNIRKQMSKRSFKFIATLVALAVATCAGFWFVYAPEHWLTRVEFGTVTVDERSVQADVYIGHPTQNEAEAIAFVHVTRVGDYSPDFEGEGY
jgi:hypothetical protein